MKEDETIVLVALLLFEGAGVTVVRAGTLMKVLKELKRCRHCFGEGCVPGDPEGDPLEDCQYCKGLGRTTSGLRPRALGHIFPSEADPNIVRIGRTHSARYHLTERGQEVAGRLASGQLRLELGPLVEDLRGAERYKTAWGGKR